MNEDTKARWLSKIIDADCKLPAYVFSKRFRAHLFFDADVATTTPLMDELRALSDEHLGSDANFFVFSGSDRRLVGMLGARDDWPSRMHSMAKGMRAENDYGGMYWVDRHERMAVYQSQPGEWGVVGLDASLHWNTVVASTGNTYFDTALFDVKALVSLESGGGFRGTSISDAIGRSFLTSLIENYG